ncbi:endonuclease NucS [Haloprofundus halobius]|uniref:endonuclease NucS n=1 Tax=Haloprofundus halobius TaxID=2876194 RepID=UPI001CC9E1F8|nr:endonuclease NucS [Haloprofundus halobius]
MTDDERAAEGGDAGNDAETDRRAHAVTLHRPTHRDVLWQVEEAFERGDMVTLFGRCTVEYDGRAASTLGLGNRLVILKPDGAALVHTDEKRTPVNWQPPGCEHHAAVRDGQFRVRSERTTPDETLDVRFEQVHQVSSLAVTGGRDLDLQGSEEDLRQHILDDPDLVESGFLPLATERETSAGPVDIYGEDDDGVPVAVELKRRRVGPSAAGQLQRYVAALREEFGDGTAVRGILVAPSVTDRAAALLEERGLGFVALDPTTGRPPEDSTE